MEAATLSQCEVKRLSALERYDILDTSPEEAFDRITRLALKVFRMPMSTISFIDGHRQWLKSRYGVNFSETARCDAICDLAIRQIEPLVIENAAKDTRVCDHRVVAHAPHIRFYAGAQLWARKDLCVGTLCVMDTKPQDFGREQVAILADLAKFVMTELNLRLLANTDSLTGALSRRALKEEAERVTLLALRHGHPLSLITFDLDHFKAINDLHGHHVGDVVLQSCMEACQSVLRKSDILGRTGGEEFAVILPHTDIGSAAEVAEKLRRAIANMSIPVASNSGVKISASFGIAELDRASPDIDELLRRADEALYLSKNAGRNRCSEWRAITPSQPNPVRKVLKPGQIAFNQGNSVIECTVRGLSDTAAVLEVFDPVGVPDKFKLKVISDDSDRRCKVKAKKNKRIEVDFA